MQLKRIDKTKEMTVDYAFLLLLKVLHGFKIFRRRDVVYGLPLDAFDGYGEMSDFATTNLASVPGGTATGTVELAAGEARVFSIHNVGVDRVDAHADYQADTAGLRHQIRLVLPIPQRVGAFSGLAIATTDLPDMPQVPIPYQGLSAPLIEAQPSVIAARRGTGLDASLTLVSAHRIAFRVTHAHATDARIRVTLDLAGSQPCIHVTSNAPAETLHGAIVRIATDHPICRVIEVPIRSSIASARM